MKSLPKDNTMMEEEDDVMDEIDDSDLDAFIPEEVAGKNGGGEENDDHSEEESDESEDEELNEKNSKESKVEQNLKDAEEQEDEDDVEEADEDEEEEEEENSSPRRSSRFNPNTSEADKNVEEQTEEGRVEEEKEPLRRSSRLSIPTCESESVEKEKEQVEVIHLDEEEKPEERDEEVKDGSNEEKDKEMKEKKDKSEEEVEEQIINLARMVKDKKQEEMVLMEAKGELNSSEEGEEIKEISMVGKDQVMEEEADKDEEMDDIDDSDLDAFLPNNEKADPKTNEDVENKEINTKKLAEVEGTENDSESDYEEIMEDEEEDDEEAAKVPAENVKAKEIIKTNASNKVSVPTKPSEPTKANPNVSIESILSQYDQLNTVKVTKVEPKGSGESFEEDNVKSILTKYDSNGLVLVKAKTVPPAIVKEELKAPVADIETNLPEVTEDANDGECMEDSENSKSGNFDFTSLAGLSDDEEEMEEESKEKQALVKQVKEETVGMKQEETLAEMVEQVGF